MKSWSIILFLAFTWCQFNTSVYSQSGYVLELYAQDTILKASLGIPKSKGKYPNCLDSTCTKIRFRDSMQADRYLYELRQMALTLGYLEFSADSVAPRKVHLRHGRQYQKLRLSTDIDTAVVRALPYLSLLNDTFVTALEVFQYRQVVFHTLEENGYPFALLALTTDWSTDTLAKLKVVSGKRIRFTIPMSTGYSQRFVQQVTGIVPGQYYRFSQVQELESRLTKTNDWVRLATKPVVIFEGEKATVKLDFKPAQPNRFDFVLGFLPDPITNKTTVTGTLDAYLFNSLKQAEVIELHFERLRPQTQRMETSLKLPYLYTLPFGMVSELNLYKRDTAFLDVQFKAGLIYPLRKGQLELSWLRNSSQLLTLDTQLIKSNLRLPDVLDMQSNLVMAQYQLKAYDQRFNPQRGFGIQTDARVGLVQVQRNANIEQLRRSDLPDFDFRTLYDTARVGGNRLQFNLKTDYFFKTSKLTTLRVGVQSGLFLSGNTLLRNELYRLGGFQQLRGFDEDAFFARSFLFGISEIRLLTGERSHMAVFVERAQLQTYVSRGTEQELNTLALGAAMQLETKGGVFGLSLAVGRVNDLPLDFRAPKVHIGFLSKI
jgi:hemolysin activation/secretion protein